MGKGDQERAPGPETRMGKGDFAPGALTTRPGQEQDAWLLEAEVEGGGL